MTKVDASYATDPYVTIDSSSIYFFFNSLANPQLPDIKVGDHVEILSQPGYEAYGGIASTSVVAVQTPRGTWFDSIYGGEVAPFTPHTWALHEVLRWSALVLGIMVALFGAASLVRWIPSTQQRPAPIGGAPGADPASVGDALGAPIELPTIQPPDVAGERVVQASPHGSLPSSDRAAHGVLVGTITVVALPILELIAVVAGLGSCSAAGFMDVSLIVITIALTAGGISTLVLASKGAGGSPQRAPARRLGIVAIVMAFVSLPINAFLVLLSGFCAVG